MVKSKIPQESRLKLFFYSRHRQNNCISNKYNKLFAGLTYNLDLKMYHSLAERQETNTGCLEMLEIFSEMSKKGNGRTVESRRSKVFSIFSED